MTRPFLLAFSERAFKPPFTNLAFFVWLFFVWCFLFHPDSPLLLAAFWDEDDYLHFVRVIDWLEGQSWFDPMVYRMAPPEGVAIHYSRLAELPLAAIMAPLHALGMEWKYAAYLAACLYPAILFGVFLKALLWVSQEVIDPLWSRSIAFVALFSPYLTFHFSIGRVDHHGLAVVLVLMATGCMLRLIREPAKLVWPIGAGFFLALGQSIALESLLWVLGLSFWVGAYAVWGVRAYAKAGAVFGLSFYVFSHLFLALTVAPEAFFATTASAYSYLYVFMAGAIASVFLATWLLSGFSSKAVRFIGSAVMALAVGGGFFALFPEVVKGPYGGVDPALATLLFPNISEAAAKVDVVENPLRLFVLILGPLAGLLASVCFVFRSQGAARLRWFFFALATGLSLGLALYYQQRITLYAQLFSIFALTELFRRGWLYIGKTKKGRPRFAAELGLILLVGPLLGVIAPALMDGRRFNTGVLMFPVLAKPQTESMGHG
ncbi:MAG: hypothetical protein AB7E52_07540, partial [Bdellovibrionales bacterium]